jgi:hypothetical protein
LKNIEFQLKTQRLVFGFYEKMTLHDENGSKFVFHPGEAHIISRLDVSMLYIIFRGFKKYLLLPQNLKG